MFNLKKAALTALLASSALLVPAAVSADYEAITADKNTINIVVEGKRVVADNFLYNDTTYVPLRRVAEMLGKNVEWNEAENAALITDTENAQVTGEDASELKEAANQSLSVERNTINIFVNGQKVDADNFLYNDTTYVPLRKVSEMLSKDVSWNQLTNTASIGAKMPSVFDGKVLGTINGREYTDTLFNGYKNLLMLSGSLNEDDNSDEIALEQIKQDYAIMDMALELGVTSGVSFENEYWRNVNNTVAGIGGDEAFDELLTQNGYTRETYYYIQLMNNIYAKLAANPVFAPQEEEVKNYYENNKDTVFAFDGLRAKHVLIMPEADEDGNSTDEQWKTALDKANEVYKLAKDGADFDSLIEKYNMDPGVLQNPDGYTFGKGQMVKEFEEKCYSMNEGEISEPVKTNYGYHIIKLEEKLPYYKFDENVEQFIENNIILEKLGNRIKAITDSAVVESNIENK